MTAALERLIRQRPRIRQDVAQRCDLCGEPVPDEHRHVLDTDRHEVQCACHACGVLFQRPAASAGHYRMIGLRRLRLAELPTAGLGVPVGLAFFVQDPAGRVIAHYPSPLGTTDWEVDADAWAHLTSQEPALAGMQPEVEALLVNTAWGAHEYWLVPVDDCFRLVALVRREWKGLSGGGTVWPRITEFFAELTERPG